MQEGRDWSADLSGDGRWITYGELAAARAIDRQSAIKLVRRQRWRRQVGNDGVTRVYVPSDWLSPGRSRDPGRDEAGDSTPDTGLMARGLAALEDAVQVLRDQLQRAERRAGASDQRANEAELGAEAANERAAQAQTLADRALAQLADAVTRADRAEAVTAGERTRADLATAHLADATAAAASASATHASEISSLRDRLDAAQQAATEALQAGNALRRADEARRGKGLWGRLLGAWRGG